MQISTVNCMEINHKNVNHNMLYKESYCNNFSVTHKNVHTGIHMRYSTVLYEDMYIVALNGRQCHRS